MAHAKAQCRVKNNLCVLNEDIMLLMGAAILDMLEPLCQLHSKGQTMAYYNRYYQWFLLSSFCSRSKILISCDRVSGHLEWTTAGWKQSYHLSWTNQSCTVTRMIPMYIYHTLMTSRGEIKKHSRWLQGLEG